MNRTQPTAAELVSIQSDVEKSIALLTGVKEKLTATSPIEMVEPTKAAPAPAKTKKAAEELIGGEKFAHALHGLTKEDIELVKPHLTNAAPYGQEFPVSEKLPSDMLTVYSNPVGKEHSKKFYPLEGKARDSYYDVRHSVQNAKKLGKAKTILADLAEAFKNLPDTITQDNFKIVLDFIAEYSLFEERLCNDTGNSKRCHEFQRHYLKLAEYGWIDTKVKGTSNKTVFDEGKGIHAPREWQNAELQDLYNDYRNIVKELLNSPPGDVTKASNLVGSTFMEGDNPGNLDIITHGLVMGRSLYQRTFNDFAAADVRKRGRPAKQMAPAKIKSSKHVEADDPKAALKVA